jgi:hypothetical protein
MMTRKLIIFVVGHEDWGKTRTLNSLKANYPSQGRRIWVEDTEFLVRTMSNDDMWESYTRFMADTSRSAIIAALCPKFKALMSPAEISGKAIDGLLNSLKLRGYELIFWVIERQWGTKRKITPGELSELRRFGTVTILSEQVESNVRAAKLYEFVTRVCSARFPEAP